MQQRRELFEKLQINAKNRLQGLKTDGETGQKAKSNVSYKGAGQMPKEDDVRKLRIFVGKSVVRFSCLCAYVLYRISSNYLLISLPFVKIKSTRR